MQLRKRHNNAVQQVTTGPHTFHSEYVLAKVVNATNGGVVSRGAWHALLIEKAVVKAGNTGE